MARRANQDPNVDPDEDPNKIIDIDIAPYVVSPLVFETPGQVQTAFEGLLDRVPGANAQNGEFIERKIRASLLHLQFLAGDKIPFREHVQTAMGVTPELIDEDELDKQQEALDAELKKHGLGFESRYAEAFDDQLVLKEPKVEIEKRLLGAAAWAGQLIADYTGRKPLVVTPAITEVDKSWVGWFGTRTGSGKPFFKMNVHPRHKHTPARIGAIAVHEMGHGTHFGIWKEAILRRDMSPVMGVTTMHTPENTQAEAYAQLIEQIGLRSFGGRDAWQYQWQADYHDYLERVWNNAHIMINTGYDEPKVVDYVTGRLPFTAVDTIKQDVPERRDDPMIRGYFACYEPALDAVRPVLAMPTEQQKAVIARLGSQPLTEAQMRAVVAG